MHMSQPGNVVPSETKKQKVIVVGSGVGGLSVAARISSAFIHDHLGKLNLLLQLEAERDITKEKLSRQMKRNVESINTQCRNPAKKKTTSLKKSYSQE